MNIKKLFFISVFSIVLTGCGSTKVYLSDFKKENIPNQKLNIEDVNVPTDFYLVNKTWLLTKVNDNLLPKNITVTMKFQEGFNTKYPVMLSGKSACNSYTTDIRVDDESKNISLSSEFTSTKKTCFEDNVMKMEDAFVNLLKQNKKIFRKNQTELILIDDKNKRFLFTQI